MNSEDKFKDLLKQKLEGKEFSFNPGNWDKAQQLIDAAREKKKRRAGLLLWSLLLILGTGTFFILNLPADAPLKATATPLPEKSTGTTPSTDNAPEKEQPEKSTINPITETNGPAAAQATGKQSSAGTTKRTENTSTGAPENTLLQPAHGSSNYAASPRKTGPAAGLLPAKKTKSPSVALPVATQVQGQPPAKPALAATLPETAVTKKEAAPAPANMPATDKETVTKGQTALKNQNPPETPAALPPALPKEEAAAAAAETSPGSEAQPVTETKTEATPTLVPEAPASPSVAAKDSAVVAAATPTAVVDENLFPRNVVYVEAGSTYLGGWKNNGTHDARGFNPLVGIGYMNFLSKTISLSLGVQYSSVGHLTAYSHTSTVTKMGLGEERSVTVITPSKMHYLAAPLKVNFMLSQKDVLGIGYTLGYLLTIDNRVETYEQRTNFAEQAHSVSKTKGYTDGFSTFDSQLSVFYRRNVYKNLWINAEALVGITDVRSNAFFGNATRERNYGFKLSLVYNLFKR